MPKSHIILKYPVCILTASLLLAAFFIVPSASAQPPPPPEGNEPGAMAGRFQSEAEEAESRVGMKEPKKPQIEIEPEKAKAEAEAGPAFTLKGVNVTGSTVFKPEDFKGVYEPSVGKEVTFADVEAMAARIKDLYKKKGYLTTVVYIPEQDIAEGVIEIRIAEGKMGEVMIEGTKWYSKDLIRKYVHVKKNELLDILKFERDLIRINQNPDVEVKAVVSEGKEPGTSDITLKVTDKFPYHAGGIVDDQGTRLTGKYRDSITFRSTNLTGHNDSVYYSTIMSATSSGNFLTYALPVDTYGTKAAFDFTQFYSLLGLEYKGFHITGYTQIYTPHMSGEVYLSDALQINADAGLEIKSVLRNINGNKSSDDQLRLPYFALDIMKIDSLMGGGQTSFSQKVTFGTSHFLGASGFNHTAAARHYTCGFFTKYEHSIRRYQKYVFDSYLIMRSQMQFASHTLPSSEQLQLGGMYTVRGYPEGDYLADYGATLNVDWYFPCYIISKDYKLPYADKPLRYQIEPVAFFDLGGGGLMATNPGELRHKILAGVGGGVKISFNRNVFITLEWAQAISEEGPAQNNGASTFFTTMQFEI